MSGPHKIIDAGILAETLSQGHIRMLDGSRRVGNSISLSDSEDESSAATRSRTSSRRSYDNLGRGRAIRPRLPDSGIGYFAGPEPCTVDPLTLWADGTEGRAYAACRRGLVGSSKSISLSALVDLPKPTRFLGEWPAGRGWELGSGRPLGKLLRFGAEVGSAVLCELDMDDAPLRRLLTG